MSNNQRVKALVASDGCGQGFFHSGKSGKETMYGILYGGKWVVDYWTKARVEFATRKEAETWREARFGRGGFVSKV